MALLLVQGACGDGSPKPVAPPTDPSPLVLGQLPSFRLTDQDSKPFGTTDLLGKVSVVSFFFTRCAGACPRQTEQMTELQSRLRNHPQRDSVRLLSITIDPEFDTPEVLYEYAATAHANPYFWTFLTGSGDETGKLSEGLQPPVQETAGDGVMPVLHATKLCLLDTLGRVRGYYDGLSAEGLVDLQADIEKVLDEPRLFPQLDGIFDPPWIGPRRDAQLEAAKSYRPYHDFAFVDRQPESGITFRHRMTPAGMKDYIPNHYDHCNGVAVADVDGDGLHDVFFTQQVGRNELWRNLGGGKFEDITERAGVGLADRISVTGAFADLDNDGDPDLYVTSVRAGNVLFVNDGKGNFRDATEGSGLGHSGHSSTPVFFDYDRDGLLDCFLTNVGQYTYEKVLPATKDKGPDAPVYHPGFADAFAGHIKEERSERNLLFRNLGGNRFEDVSDATGLDDWSWTGDASPVDVNGDGWLDLYVLDMQGHDQYWENVEGKKFVKKSREVFPRTPWGSMGIKWFDFDNDGLLDIYITDMHSDMATEIGPELENLKSEGMESWPESLLRSGGLSIFGNAFYRNLGGGKFEEISDAIGAELYWPWGLSVGDLNADGFLDAFVTTSMNYQFRYQPNAVLLNDQGERFLQAEYVLGVEPRRGGKTTMEWFTLDADEPCAPSIARGLQGFDSDGVVLWSALGSRSSVILDLEGDGDLDIVTAECHSVPLVLVSDLAERHPRLRYLEVDLRGTKSNRDALGARVTVTAGGRSYAQVHDGQSGYLSQSSYPLYFGLDDADVIEKIEIAWPSGRRQSVTGPIVPNQRLVVTEEYGDEEYGVR